MGFDRRQLREPLCSRIGVRAAASLSLVKSTASGQMGTCDRRHGRDYSGDGGGSAGTWRANRPRGAGRAGDRRRGSRRRRRTESGEVVACAGGRSERQSQVVLSTIIDASSINDEFVEAIGRYKCGSGTFRMNVALSELPDFAALHRDCTAATSRERHRVRSVSGLHGSCLASTPSAGYSARTDRRDADPERCRRHACAAGEHVASLFCQQFEPTADWSVLKSRPSQASSTSCRSTARTSAHRCWISSDSPADFETNSDLSAATFFMGSSRLTSCSRCGPCTGLCAISRTPQGACTTAGRARIRAAV